MCSINKVDIVSRHSWQRVNYETLIGITNLNEWNACTIRIKLVKNMNIEQQVENLS